MPHRVSDDAAEPRCTVRAPQMAEVDRTVENGELRLEQYEPDDPETIRRQIETIDVPDDLQAVMDAYYDHLDDRAPYQWKWLFWAFDECQLSCVADEYHEKVAVVKTALAVYNALVDDIAEDKNDSETFWEVAKSVFPGSEPNWDRGDIDTDYARAGQAMWSKVSELISQAPRYEEYRDLWLFDVRNALTAMDYSYLTTRHAGLTNDVESWLYDTHNVMTVGLTTVDLMFSPSFDTDDLRPLRRVLYPAMEMWRIGNWLMTWQRELVEGDHSSAVVITALREGIVSEEELEAIEAGMVSPDPVIERIKSANIEEAYLFEWERRRDVIMSRVDEFNSVAIEDFIRALERVISAQLVSRGKVKAES